MNFLTFSQKYTEIQQIFCTRKDLNSRESRIRDKEDEIDVRIKRVEKREDEYKLDIKTIEKKDDELRSRTRDITEKELDLQEKSQELNERERNLSRTALSSAKEIDSKYAELRAGRRRGFLDSPPPAPS